MSSFRYIGDTLYCENVSLKQIAEEVGTPFYVYSAQDFKDNYKDFYNSFKNIDRIVCFAVKACGNIAVLALLGQEGCGADIVSGGELHRALTAGMDTSKIVFAGVGKTGKEITKAIKANILMFNAESRQEVDLINSCAERLGKRARVALRVNPNVDAKTHPYISTGLKQNKFGIPFEGIREEYRYANSLPNIDVVGIHCHIGSQLTDITPFRDATEILVKLVKDLRRDDINIKFLDLGGGLGVKYDNPHAPSRTAYAETIVQALGDLDITVVLEPGRNIAADAGVLVTQVLYTKETDEKNFKIVDAAMNDLARPSLYDAYHDVLSVDQTDETITADIVGPICETGDFLVKNREIPDVDRCGLYAIMSAGAYGMTMASNYNSRPRIPEILVDGQNYHIVRRREIYEDLTGPEIVPDYLRKK